MEEADYVPRLKALLEMAAGTAGIIAATGYISLRARLNYLGVVAGGFDAETYLFEAYSFLAPAIATIAFPMFGVLSLWTIGQSRWTGAAGKPFGRGQLLTRLTTLSRAWQASLLVGIAVLLYVTRPDPKNVHILYQTLDILSRGVVSDRLTVGDLTGFFMLLSALLMTVWVTTDGSIWRKFAATEARFVLFSRFVFFIASLCLFWNCIVYQTTHLRHVAFRTAVVIDKSETVAGCGFLVISTGAEHILWVKAEAGTGKLLFVPRSDKTMLLGDLRDLKDAAADLDANRYCSQFKSIPKSSRA
jgi:hypothetical protein